jgi:hypothetical protein
MEGIAESFQGANHSNVRGVGKWDVGGLANQLDMMLELDGNLVVLVVH